MQLINNRRPHFLPTRLVALLRAGQGVLSLLVTVCMVTRAQAISITSHDFELTANWVEEWRDANHVQHDTSGHFDLSSTVEPQISGSVQSSPYGFVRASGTLDSFNLSMSSFAAPWNFVLQDGGFAIGSSIYSSAIADTHFVTAGTELSITLNGHARFNYLASEQSMQMTLIDTTTAVTLLDITGLDFRGLTYQLGVDPSHEYELLLSGKIRAFDAKEVDMGMNVLISDATVPESGNTLMMFAMALGWLAGFWVLGRRAGWGG